jgi:hypothetical protein
MENWVQVKVVAVAMFSERHGRINQITMSLPAFTHVHPYLQFNGHRTILIIGESRTFKGSD